MPQYRRQVGPPTSLFDQPRLDARVDREVLVSICQAGNDAAVLSAAMTVQPS
jgi:hypothetical protein